MSTRYAPPKQSIAGQLFDVGFLLALVFVTLFVPIWMGIAVPSRVEKLPAGVTYKSVPDPKNPDQKVKEWTGLTWGVLGQNPTMQTQWEKLGYTKETAADIITQPFDYEVDVAGVTITGLVILGYFVFLMVVSRREYKQVIAEKFG